MHCVQCVIVHCSFGPFDTFCLYQNFLFVVERVCVCVRLVTLKAVCVVCVFQACDEAMAKPVDSDSHKDSFLILQLLRDNLTVTT